MILLSGYGIQLLQGAAISIALTACALAVGSILGLFGACAKLSKQRPLVVLAEVYTSVIRGVPDLVIILILYFGGTVTLSNLLGRYVDVSEFGAGVAAFGFVFGAYASEIFRGAISGVPVGQTEAANALGLTPARAFFLVVFPQAWRLAIPAFGNQTVILLKQTSLVSVIGLEELSRAGSVIAGATREPFTVYAGTALIYLALTATATGLLQWAERHSATRLVRAT
jgi:His/Glu/Gln/Arg/opine family amino acid ABC transporter permease subunit